MREKRRGRPATLFPSFCATLLNLCGRSRRRTVIQDSMNVCKPIALLDIQEEGFQTLLATHASILHEDPQIRIALRVRARPSLDGLRRPDGGRGREH